jgi:hypothetical protein
MNVPNLQINVNTRKCASSRLVFETGREEEFYGTLVRPHGLSNRDKRKNK